MPNFNSYKLIDLSNIKTKSLFDRKSLVEINSFAKIPKKGKSFSQFIEDLPNYLAAKELKLLAHAINQAKINNKPIIWGMGSHVIKVGLSPLLTFLMENGFITTISLNGSGVIHDSELALAGKTSEDVAEGLTDGSFGMSRETAELVNKAADYAAENSIGLGNAIGKSLLELNPKFVEYSVCASAAKLNIPVTVHVAVGTDIVHMHPSANGASIGASSHYDFKILCSIVSNLGNGGVYLNIGSAVILPEIFLKALNVARNINGQIDNFTTANFDFIKQYRSLQNVLNRPTKNSKSNSHSLTGHHEIMLPILAQYLIDL